MEKKKTMRKRHDRTRRGQQCPAHGARRPRGQRAWSVRNRATTAPAPRPFPPHSAYRGRAPAHHNATIPRLVPLRHTPHAPTPADCRPPRPPHWHATPSRPSSRPRCLHSCLHPLVVLPRVLLEQPCRLRVGRRVWVGVTQQRLDRREDGGNVIDGGPVVLKDVQADTAVRVDVGVEEAAHKLDDGGLVGVVFREMHCEFEGATFPSCVIWAVAI